MMVGKEEGTEREKKYFKRMAVQVIFYEESANVKISASSGRRLHFLGDCKIVFIKSIQFPDFRYNIETVWLNLWLHEQFEASQQGINFIDLEVNEEKNFAATPLSYLNRKIKVVVDTGQH